MSSAATSSALRELGLSVETGAYETDEPQRMSAIKKLFLEWCQYIDKTPNLGSGLEISDEQLKAYIQYIDEGSRDASTPDVIKNLREIISSDSEQSAQIRKTIAIMNKQDSLQDDDELLKRFINEFLQLENKLSPKILNLLLVREFVSRKEFLKDPFPVFKIGPNLMRLIKIRAKSINPAVKMRERSIRDTDTLISAMAEIIPSNGTRLNFYAVDIDTELVPSCGNACGDWIWLLRKEQGLTSDKFSAKHRCIRSQTLREAERRGFRI